MGLGVKEVLLVKDCSCSQREVLWKTKLLALEYSSRRALKRDQMNVFVRLTFALRRFEIVPHCALQVTGNDCIIFSPHALRNLRFSQNDVVFVSREVGLNWRGSGFGDRCNFLDLGEHAK